MRRKTSWRFALFTEDAMRREDYEYMEAKEWHRMKQERKRLGVQEDKRSSAPMWICVACVLICVAVVLL